MPHLARSGLNTVFALECVSLGFLAYFLADPDARLSAGGAWVLWVVNALKHVALAHAAVATGVRTWRTVREHGLIEQPSAERAGRYKVVGPQRHLAMLRALHAALPAGIRR